MLKHRLSKSLAQVGSESIIPILEQTVLRANCAVFLRVEHLRVEDVTQFHGGPSLQIVDLVVEEDRVFVSVSLRSLQSVECGPTVQLIESYG